MNLSKIQSLHAPTITVAKNYVLLALEGESQEIKDRVINNLAVLTARILEVQRGLAHGSIPPSLRPKDAIGVNVHGKAFTEADLMAHGQDWGDTERISTVVLRQQK